MQQEERDCGKVSGVKKITVRKLLGKIQLLLPGWNTVSTSDLPHTTQHNLRGTKGRWNGDTKARVC